MVEGAGAGPVVRAEAFGMPAFDADGNDLLAVDELAADVIGRVRSGGGPHFVHARTYRINGHVSRDKMLYRAEGETERHWKNEPIGRCAAWLLENGIGQDEIDAAGAAAYEQINAAPSPLAAGRDTGRPKWRESSGRLGHAAGRTRSRHARPRRCVAAAMLMA